MKKFPTTLTTDVLVLGSSASGCGAAIAARRQDARVLLVDKGVLESSGNLGGGNDHFMAVLDQDEHDGLQDMLDYYVSPCSGISAAVVEHYYRCCPACLDVLIDCGIELMHNPDGSYMRSTGFGQPGAWWIHINHGYEVKPRLAKYIRKHGIDVLDHFLVTALLKDGHRIAGCVGFDVLTGEYREISCKSAVMCFGLSAQRVSNNSSHKPFNIWLSPYVTGSQVMLPLKIGASVANMDIADMATLIPKGWGAPGMNGINNMGGRELNAAGERFMGKYDPMMENGVRRNQVMGTVREQLVHGVPFYMDMTHFSPEDACHLQYDLMPGDKATYGDYCKARGIDFTKAPLEVEVSERMIGGLICHDDDLQSLEVQHLYVSSMMNNFSGCMAVGYAAGLGAAKSAASASATCFPREEADAQRKTMFAPQNRETEHPISYTEFEDGLRHVMDYYAGYVRSEKSMSVALERLKVLDEYKERLQARTPRELMRITESMELLELCRIYIQACMQRKETGRAMYIRADYPKLNPRYEALLITRLDASGNPVFSWKASNSSEVEHAPRF